MKKIKIILIFFICLTAAFQGFSQDKDEMHKEWVKMSTSKTDLYKEYNDLKFGMFIHWGAYSTLGGTWKGQQIHGLGEWIMYRAQIPREEYKQVCKKFYPTGFNADEWVKLAKEAGMKYMVAMTKHHDGFSMYQSKISDFNIYEYPQFKRDPIEEIYEACKKYGIRLGLYYSHSIDWMDGGDAGAAQYKKKLPTTPEMEASENHAEMYAANIWDPSPATYDDYITGKAKPQMQEILTKFPDLIEIWYDYPIYMNFQQSFDFYKLAYDIQPKCLINKRVGNDLGDILTAGDNEIPSENSGETKPFETPGTLNDTWGYKSYDHNWKSLKEMLFWIAEIASKGGNYLLNVGPDGNGVIPEESVKILKGIGAWMKINGEAIYGTNKWTTIKEGPTKIDMKSTEYRANNKIDFSFTPEDFWFTSKDNNVYVISLTTPTNETVSVKSLWDCHQKIKSIKLLGNEGSLKWKTRSDKVDIALPKNIKADQIGFVLKVELTNASMRSRTEKVLGIDSLKLAEIPVSLQKFVDEKKIAGAVTLVEHNGQIISYETIGFQDIEKKIPMQKNTIFRIASMTKPFAAAAIMMLCEGGRLQLNDPVEKYLPEFHNMWLVSDITAEKSSLIRPKRQITIRDILTHTAGLADLPSNISINSISEYVQTISQLPLQFEPGSQWKYSGSGITTAARIVEVISGQSYDVFLSERIFKPLGMVDTSFFPEKKSLERIAALYRPSANSGLEVIDAPDLSKFPRPEGGLFSTAPDMAKWMQALLNMGVYIGTRILTEKSVREMTKIQIGELKAGFTAGMSYGLAFGIVRDPSGVTSMLSRGTFGHGGRFGSQSWADPLNNTIYILMIQRESFGNGDASDIRNAFQKIAAEAIKE